MSGFDQYAEIWVVDSEYYAPAGERQVPACIVARELRTGSVVRRVYGEFASAPPFGVDGRALYVSFYASAEMGTHLALGWPLPRNIVDLFAEFRVATNGRETPAGSGLLGALAYHGLDSISAAQKDPGREIAMRGPPWGEEQRAQLLAYCTSDVDATARLFDRMAPAIDLPRALFRGRYMAAAARMEWNGTPIDTATLATLREQWEHIQTDLIAEIDKDYGCFEGTTFKRALFEQFLARNGIAWPRLKSGQLDLEDDTFKEIARSNPIIAPLREIRSSLSQMRLARLSVGSDARNRAMLSAFGASSGRNTPSNTKFIFGPSVWMRGLIKPEPNTALAYIDWSAQEFGIAAALSGDERMMAAYRSGDPYLEFARQAGAVPVDATKQSHKSTRDMFKTVVLGVGYGMEAETLAGRLGISTIESRALLQKHRETYPQFCRWSQNSVDTAMSGTPLNTVFGWRYTVGPHLRRAEANPRTVRNFPMQANGAEMLRIACCLATERGVRVCAPVHDAILIEAPADQIEAEVVRMGGYMAAASRIVLAGFELRTDAEIIRYPDRYSDARGQVMWDRVMKLLRARAPVAYG